MTEPKGKKAIEDTGRARPVVLCILDGWGHRDDKDHNAIRLARTPNYDRMWESCPRALLQTSGEAVGLPEGQMGNSEVGHMNIGSGRVVAQSLPRISAAFADGELDRNTDFVRLVERLQRSEGTCHLIGLLSPGGVHSHDDQIIVLIRALAGHGIPVAIHGILDGRDVPPKSALEYIAKFEAEIAGLKGVQFATISGRFYAMDRDKRWQRTIFAYDAMTLGEGLKALNASSAVTASYERDKTDEFVRPTIIGDFDGMCDDDGLIMANFRADRARQILSALCDPSFNHFERRRKVSFAAKLGMVSYSIDLDDHLDVLFPPVSVAKSLGEVVSLAGLRQLRIAETEKYAHVTFFFNGGQERVFNGEDRILVPSPKVSTYDLKPEMSASEVTDGLVGAIESGAYDMIVCNYANPDMVGHTGNLEAAIKAVETVDHCLARILRALGDTDGVLILTADHGNVEMMKDIETGAPYTAHTSLDVPVLFYGASIGPGAFDIVDGKLADIAPTVLQFMGLEVPGEMTGKSLLRPASGRLERGRKHA